MDYTFTPIACKRVAVIEIEGALTFLSSRCPLALISRAVRMMERPLPVPPVIEPLAFVPVMRTCLVNTKLAHAKHTASPKEAPLYGTHGAVAQARRYGTTRIRARDSIGKTRPSRGSRHAEW